MRAEIGGQQIGLAGLESAFNAWLAAGRGPDQLTDQELSAAVRRANYVPARLAGEYIRAVRHLYREWVKCSK
jgi:hypothetical protein